MTNRAIMKSVGVALSLVAGVGMALALVVGLAFLTNPVHAQVRAHEFTCVVTVSTSTSLTAVGGECVGQNPPLALYITDIVASTNAAGIAADSYNTLKYGTGTVCGTGTTTAWLGMTIAATQATLIESPRTAIRIPPGNDLCWINSTAGSKSWVISGYVAP